ncbi:MAG: DegT/DnrJ/EryC1/StrS aminotransferase family protein [Pseudomonadota bacterium]|nr:DegT/DnrJ/EryC1/StrS aminotransferase family protein [Pseudomonadota bacterium]MDE3037333.1 DegT/DnrJ/EryC1/StrS aminotransferase family protein [Pseudomonadota bacterium]
MADVEFLPFARPALSEAAIEEVVATLRSGWITTGPRVQKFEEMLSACHGGRRALALSSATAGLHVALLALTLETGDEVITTPLTFAATLNVIALAGATPVLVDIDPATLNMDVSRLEAAITPRTRVLMPVHFAGLPCDLDMIYALAKKHSLRVVEDCAHAIGAEYKGKKLGSFGDIAVMSFHPNKNMTTGEGGAVITDDKEVISAIERLRFHGIDRNAFNRFAKGGSQQYDVVLPGFKYNMMDIQAALGLHQLPELDGFIKKRAALVKRYYEALENWPELILPQAPTYAHTHAWHLFTPRLNDRDGFITAMKAENIGVGLHYQAAHMFSWYKERYDWKPEDFPNALAAGNSIASLPLFPTMTEAEQDRVIKAMEKVLKA